MNSGRYRVLLVGGGLANCLIALRLVQTRVDCDVLILESAERVCGNHTWSFHHTDLDPKGFAFVAPLVTHSWNAQRVLFPSYSRTLRTGYASITSDRLREADEQHPQIGIRASCCVRDITPSGVVLSGGESVTADCVVDGRGKVTSPHLILGFQKFLGLEIELTEPHELAIPVIMDVRIPQQDGFRFIYVLPFSPSRLLVEDTRYSDTGDLDDGGMERFVLEYVQMQGWKTGHIVRREHGVLPLILAGNARAFWSGAPSGVARSGIGAGLFHPTTGYSLPLAVKVAIHVAECARMDSASVHRCIATIARREWRRQGLFRLVNRMMFIAAKSSERWIMMERFYRLPEELIERFYASRLRLKDKIRILVDRPPLPIAKGLGVLSEKAFIKRARPS